MKDKSMSLRMKSLNYIINDDDVINMAINFNNFTFKDILFNAYYTTSCFLLSLLTNPTYLNIITKVIPQ